MKALLLLVAVHCCTLSVLGAFNLLFEKLADIQAREPSRLESPNTTQQVGHSHFTLVRGYGGFFGLLQSKIVSKSQFCVVLRVEPEHGKDDLLALVASLTVAAGMRYGLRISVHNSSALSFDIAQAVTHLNQIYPYNKGDPLLRLSKPSSLRPDAAVALTEALQELLADTYYEGSTRSASKLRQCHFVLITRALGLYTDHFMDTLAWRISRNPDMNAMTCAYLESSTADPGALRVHEPVAVPLSNVHLGATVFSADALRHIKPVFTSSDLSSVHGEGFVERVAAAGKPEQIGVVDSVYYIPA